MRFPGQPDEKMGQVKDMPKEAIKLYITNIEGKFEVKGNIDYQEAFFDLEECVSEKK